MDKDPNPYVGVPLTSTADCPATAALLLCFGRYTYRREISLDRHGGHDHLYLRSSTLHEPIRTARQAYPTSAGCLASQDGRHSLSKPAALENIQPAALENFALIQQPRARSWTCVSPMEKSFVPYDCGIMTGGVKGARCSARWVGS